MFYLPQATVLSHEETQRLAGEYKGPSSEGGRPADALAEKGGEILVIEVYGGGRAIRNWGDVRYVLNRVREGWDGDQSARIAVFWCKPFLNGH